MFEPARRHAAGILGLCLATFLSACDLLGSGDCWLFCPPPPEFSVTPDAVNILRGDTVRLYARFCGGWACMDPLSAASTWNIDGSAAVVDGSAARSASGVQRLLVRGVTPGPASITARPAVDASHFQAVQLVVADSSTITKIDLRLPLQDTVRSGERAWLAVGLRDSQGTGYRGVPTQLAVSDTGVATVEVETIEFGVPKHWIRARAPGVTEIHARFLDVTAIARVVVTP
jgi:hypothetical protein